MKFITAIFKRFKNDPKPLLGRWNIEYSKKKLDKKIDLSNEDHCGPCGQYVSEKYRKPKNYESKRP